MAIIYTYPIKSNPTSSDLLIISDAVDKKTKQADITSFPIVTGWSAGDTGFTPNEFSTGNVIMDGTLNVNHGGTGIGNARGADEQTWLSGDQGTLLYFDTNTATEYEALAKIEAKTSDVDKVLTLKQVNPGTGDILVPMWVDGGTSREIEDQIKKLQDEVDQNKDGIEQANERAESAKAAAEKAQDQADKAEAQATEALDVAREANDKATANESAIADNASEIKNQANSIETLTAGQQSLDKRVTKLEQEEPQDISELEASIKELQTSITSLDSTIANQAVSYTHLTLPTTPYV